MKLNFITDSIAFDVRDHVAYITFDDPAHMNPLNAEAMRDLSTCMDACEQDEEIRMVVFRGAGGNFSAGGNVKGMKERLDQGINTTRGGIRAGGELITRVRNLRKPTLAWIEGAAAGVGLSIAMACDFSIADTASKMTFAFINIGFIPDGGIVYLLSRAVGTVRGHGAFDVRPPVYRRSGPGLGPAYGSGPGRGAGGNGAEVHTEILHRAQRRVRTAQGADQRSLLSRAGSLYAE